jgi:hypothetical protein
MSQVIGDDTVYEPTDKTIRTLDEVDHILANEGDYIRRVATSEFSGVPDHDHDGDTLLPAVIDYADGATYIQIGQASGSGNIYVYANGNIRFQNRGASGLVVTFPAGQAVLSVYGDIRTWTAGAGLYMYSDDFIVHSCFSADKENLADLADREDLIKNVIPRTYSMNNRSRMGFVVDDFMNEPGVLTYDAQGKVSGYSNISLIALLWKTLKSLISRVEVLEKRE